MKRLPRARPDLATIRASEVGQYIYCARAWWLERVQGHEPTNAEALERGRESHDAHGRLVASAVRQAAWARWLVMFALAIGVALVLSRR